MLVISIISTKGGVGKTTTTANLGGFAADAGLRVLLLDLDVQPTLSSYYSRYAEIHNGRATWGQFGLTVAIGAILLVVGIWLLTEATGIL